MKDLSLLGLPSRFISGDFTLSSLSASTPPTATRGPSFRKSTCCIRGAVPGTVLMDPEASPAISLEYELIQVVNDEVSYEQNRQKCSEFLWENLVD